MKRTLFLLLASALALRAADPAPAAPGRVIKIALNEVTIVAEQKGWLKDEFAKVGATAQLIPYSVAAVPSLIDRGDVDIANSMLGFSYIQLLNGFKPVIVWESAQVDPRNVVIVVLKDSPIKTLADLKGKTLGVAKWTVGYYGAVETLKKAGVPLDTQETPGQVRYLNLTDGLSVTTVLLAGRVDAISTLPTVLASLYKQDLIREIGTAVPDGEFVHANRTVYYAASEWAKENPDLVKAFITVQEKALLWIRSHPAEAGEIVGQVLRQPADVMEVQFREPGSQRLFLPEHDYAAAVQAFKNFQKLAFSNADGLQTASRKPFTDAQIGDLIDRRFFRGGAYYAGDDAATAQAVPPAPAPVLAGTGN